MAASGGLYRRADANTLVRVELHEDAPAIRRVDSLPDGRILAGSPTHGLFVVHPDGSVDHITVEHGLPSNQVFDVLVTNGPESRAFMATSGGLSEYVASP